MDRGEVIGRRAALALTGAAAAVALAGCDGDDGWSGVDVSGVLPDLDLAMTRAGDGRAVTEADYRGRVVALFFGFTFCPDVCPMTLANLAAVAGRLGRDAAGLSILFATVDPVRDTPETLAAYVGAFTPVADGLRGTSNQIAALARRYRVTYRVEPEAPGGYAVSHGTAVYVFDREGEGRLLLPRFDTAAADIEGAAADLSRLIRARAS